MDINSMFSTNRFVFLALLVTFAFVVYLWKRFKPKPGFKGNFHCPHCGNVFKIPVLTDYVEGEI